MRIKQFKLSSGCEIFKSFSDESRVRILNLLYNNKEVSITDIEHILDFTQSKTSRHLGYLKNAGIVSYKKKDQWTFYFIKDEVVEFIRQLFKFLEKDVTLQKDLETYRILHSNRELTVYKLRK